MDVKNWHKTLTDFETDFEKALFSFFLSHLNLFRNIPIAYGVAWVLYLYDDTISTMLRYKIDIRVLKLAIDSNKHQYRSLSAT